MFQKLNDICPNFPYSEQTKPQQKLFVLCERDYADGNFMITNLLNFYLKSNDSVVFIGCQYNYAHYQSISKKLGLTLEPHLNNQNLQYIDCFDRLLPQIPTDLPYTEDRPLSWIDAPSKIHKFTLDENDEKKSLNQLANLVSKCVSKCKGFPAIIIDNLSYFQEMIDQKQHCIGFINSLFALQKQNQTLSIYILLNSNHLDFNKKLLWMLQQNADIIIQTSPISSGYQKGISGQIELRFVESNKNNRYLYNCTDNSVEIFDHYKI